MPLWERALVTLREEGIRRVGGVMHCALCITHHLWAALIKHAAGAQESQPRSTMAGSLVMRLQPA